MKKIKAMVEAAMCLTKDNKLVQNILEQILEELNTPKVPDEKESKSFNCYLKITDDLIYEDGSLRAVLIEEFICRALCCLPSTSYKILEKAVKSICKTNTIYTGLEPGDILLVLNNVNETQARQWVYFGKKSDLKVWSEEIE